MSGANNSHVGESSDTLALLGKIRDHFCFPVVPAAQRISAFFFPAQVRDMLGQLPRVRLIEKIQ